MRNLLIMFCFFSMAATCQEQKKSPKDNPCDPSIMCTMEFKIIDLQIDDESGEAVLLDEFYSEIDGEKVEIPDDVHQLKTGVYPVATDSEMPQLQFEGTKMVFFGLIDGEVVVEHKMVIGKDCCHIQLIEGEQKITL